MKRVILLVFLGAFVVACGDSKKQDNAASSAPQEAPAAVDENVTVVTLNANDQMQFDQKTITVDAGKKVRLTLHHTGKMDKSIMGHNFVLLKQGTVIADFAQSAMESADNNYIPANTDAVIAHTPVIGGGESTTVEFDAPEAGTYDFICSFPGHYAMMQGKFVVK